MCPGLSDDLGQIEDARKTAVIDRELSKLNLDIAAIQETRLPSNGSLKEREYTFFWQGLEPSEKRLYGVGFATKPGFRVHSLYPILFLLRTHQHR